MVPKGFKKDINIAPQKIGFDRRQEILDDISEKTGYLPNGVHIEDMDQSFLDFMNSDERVTINIDGNKVPIVFLTIQRWSEFTKTWEFTDDNKNIKIPFITVVRQPDVQVGLNQAGLWNIPVNRTYTYMKVPTWDGVRKGVDLYKIPQPTSVNLTYEVRLFTNRMKDLNIFVNKIHKAFNSRQCYINVKGHPMPLHLETISDESNIDDFENRRFYVQSFEIVLYGYTLDENDFEVVPTINRTILTTEIFDDKKVSEIFDPINYSVLTSLNFVFKNNSNNNFYFKCQYDVNFTQLTSFENIKRIKICKGKNICDEIIYDSNDFTDNLTDNLCGFNDDYNLLLPTPIKFRANDFIRIEIERCGNGISKFNFNGNKI